MEVRINIVWSKFGRCAYPEGNFAGRQPIPTTIWNMYDFIDIDFEEIGSFLQMRPKRF